MLINRKTGKASSTNYDSKILAALAYTKDETDGIAGLLAKNGPKVLKHNKLAYKDLRASASIYSPSLARSQAKEFIVVLAVLYEKVMPKHKLVTRQDFVKWVVKEMANQTSEAYREATRLGFDALLHKKRSTRWWIDRLNKLQS